MGSGYVGQSQQGIFVSVSGNGNIFAVGGCKYILDGEKYDFVRL